MDDVFWKRLGQSMQRVREALELTQEELGDAIYASRSFVAQVETGRVKVSPDRLKDIAGVFIVRVRDFVATGYSPSVVMTFNLLASLAGGKEPGEEEAATDDAVMASYLTSQAMARVPSLLVDSETKSSASVISPLVGLLLLFPDIETSLLVHLLTPTEWQRKVRDKALLNRYNLFILYAPYLADQMLERLTGTSGILFEMVLKELTKGRDAKRKRAAAHEVRAMYRKTSGSEGNESPDSFERFLLGIVSEASHKA